VEHSRASGRKKLIIERHYGKASGRTLASACESFRVFGEWGRREGNAVTKSSDIGYDAKSHLTANKSQTDEDVNELNLQPLCHI